MEEQDNHDILDDTVVATPHAAAMWMPIMTSSNALRRRNLIKEFIDNKVLEPNVHWGGLESSRPGDERKVLYKGGAEALCILWGFAPNYSVVDKIEKLDVSGDEEALISYHIKCQLYRNGEFAGEGEGACNSREVKYRWRWVEDEELKALGNPRTYGKRETTLREPQFAVEKAETTGKFGKPAEYWQMFEDAIQQGHARPYKGQTKNGKDLMFWEIPGIKHKIANPEIADLQNTILKMAQKRAYVAAVISAIGVSDIFTQDLEDMPTGAGRGDYKERVPDDDRYGDDPGPGAPPQQQSAPPPQQQQPPAEPKGPDYRKQAKELYSKIADKLGLDELSEPPATAIWDAVRFAIEFETNEPMSKQPEKVVEKLGKLLELDAETGRKWLVNKATKASEGKQQAASKPAAATHNGNELSPEQFSTLNVAGMIVQLSRRLGPEHAGAIRAYIKKTFAVETIPAKSGEIQEALKLLYAMDAAEVKQKLQEA